MTDDGEVRYGAGMLPQFPMTLCPTCGHWSYLAAIDGICLRCEYELAERTVQ